MSASPPPPPYSESESKPPPHCPSYYAEQPFASSSHTRDTPSTFRVGLRDLRDPLVQIKHLKLHLHFLGALHDLKRRVESSSAGSLPPLTSELDGEQRWSWFVNLAVERQVTHICELDIRAHDPLTWTGGGLGFSAGSSIFRHLRNSTLWRNLFAEICHPLMFGWSCMRIC